MSKTEEVVGVKNNFPIVVYAGSYGQFTNWCRDNNRSPNERNLFYVSSPDIIRGLAKFTVVRVGTWHFRRDVKEFEETLQISRNAGAVL